MCRKTGFCQAVTFPVITEQAWIFPRKRCPLSARLRFQQSWYTATVFLPGFSNRNSFQRGFSDVLCISPVMKSKPMLSFAISLCPMLHHSDTNCLVRSAMMDHTDCPKTPVCRLQKFQLYKLICPNQRGRLSVALFCILRHLHPGIWHWHNTWGCTAVVYWCLAFFHPEASDVIPVTSLTVMPHMWHVSDTVLDGKEVLLHAAAATAGGTDRLGDEPLHHVTCVTTMTTHQAEVGQTCSAHNTASLVILSNKGWTW